MAQNLTERRRADRLTMAAMVKAICEEHGASCRIDENREAREVVCKIEHGGAFVNIEFDGGPFNSLPDDYCMPWNVDWQRADLRFAGAFGAAVGAEVNPFHRRKCMGFAAGMDALSRRLRAALSCINEGAAFMAPVEA